MRYCRPILAIWVALSICTLACPAQEAPQPDRLTWSQAPALPRALAGHMAGAHNGALIVAGGSTFDVSPWQGGERIWLDTAYVLPSPTDAWIKEQPLPHPLAYAAVASTPLGVVYAGGSDGIQHYAASMLLQWDGGALKRLPLPDLPSPCAYGAAAVLGTTVYIAGGQTAPDSTVALKNFWSLDVSSPGGAWQELEPWPGPARILPVVAAQAGSVYVFSGADLAAGTDGKAVRTYLTDGYRYTPKEGWQAVNGPPVATVAAEAIATGPASIVVFSGDDGSLVTRNAELGDKHPGFPGVVRAFNTITGKWSTVGEMPNPVVTTTAVAWQGGIAIPGGEDRPGHRVDAVPQAKVHTLAHRSMTVLDYAVMGAYFALLLAMGFYFSRRTSTSADFFLGGKRVPWWAAGISIFGTLLSAITFLAVPATAFRSDWVYFIGNVVSIIVAPIIVYAYLPFFRRLDVTTAYEYLEKRFNYGVRLFGGLAFLLFQLGRVGIVLYLPALMLSTATGLDVRVSILLMGVITTAYTVMGGIEAVIWTDVLQVIVLLGGALLSLVLIAHSVDGGFAAVYTTGMADGKFRMADWTWEHSATAFWVVFIGRTLENMIPYTTDQTVVQRYLTTPTEKDAARSIWLGSLMSIPSAIIFFSVGTALYVFYKGHPQLFDPAIQMDGVFPLFIVEQLPPGVTGLIIAALFAAAMSSLDSSLNSVSAVVVTDLYRRVRPDASEAAALGLARWITVFTGALGTGGALLMTTIDVTSLWEHYMKLVGLFGGGLAGLFALGIFTRRATGSGAIAGAACGAITLYFVQSQTSVSFLLYSSVGIVVSFVAGYVASFYVGRNPGDLAGLTWSTRKK
ncbi:MAG: sodium/solute symporter [Candidatus Hydrogenedentes bacterium]|nr:sodium/solute symporter [Candidatus Hydrogenedentota bacterium]